MRLPRLLRPSLAGCYERAGRAAAYRGCHRDSVERGDFRAYVLGAVTMTTTREERRARNRIAHAMRRDATNADYRQAREDGAPIGWRAIWETYASLTNDEIMVALAPAAVTVPAAVKVRRARKAPAHIAALSAEYRLVREAWEAGLADAMRGARANGRPARGEKYIDEERDYRDANPAPVWSAWLKDMGARSVAAHDAAGA